MAEQMVDVALAAQSDVDDECAHHWLIETPNGETSRGRCKACGTLKDFLNYSQRKILTRSVKPAPPVAAAAAAAPQQVSV